MKKEKIKDEDLILFVSKKTGEVLYTATKKQERQAIYFSMILTPIVVIILLWFLDKSGIAKFVIEKIKFVINFYFG